MPCDPGCNHRKSAPSKSFDEYCLQSVAPSVERTLNVQDTPHIREKPRNEHSPPTLKEVKLLRCLMRDCFGCLALEAMVAIVGSRRPNYSRGNYCSGNTRSAFKMAPNSESQHIAKRRVQWQKNFLKAQGLT
ncbi:MAG: hypothetical protein CMM01_03480 [Rhodopirellula sp.]|nr:hypothetical protein [Rhodopirellula sp.]